MIDSPSCRYCDGQANQADGVYHADGTAIRTEMLFQRGNQYRECVYGPQDQGDQTASGQNPVSADSHG